MKRDSSRVEFIAIPVVIVLLGVIFVLMLAAEAGVWAWIVVTTALVALGLIAIGLVVRRHRHPSAFDAPATAPTPTSPSDAYRVLIVADDTLSERAFRDEIAPHAAGRPVEALVIAPALRSRLAHWTGDDSEQGKAMARLAETCDGLKAVCASVTGEIGSDDPIEAADDSLRTFTADEVVFVTGGDVNWLEQDVVDLARERYRIQVTHVEGDSRARAND
jgi:hypothetical protein